MSERELPSPYRPDDRELREDPCEKTHRPARFGVDKLRYVPPAVLMRAELKGEQFWPWCTIGKLFVG